MNANLDENAPGGGADEDARLLEGAVFDQAAYDKLLAQGRIASAPMAVTSQRTDWNGLTPAQEREKEGERARQREILAEAEYQRTMQEVRDRADRLMAELDQQERELRRKLAEVKARPITLPNGHQVRFGASGEPIDEVTGHPLDGDDRTEAQRQQKEKEAEEKDLGDKLARNMEAKDHLRKAESLASQNDKNLKPEQKKQNEENARKELDKAEAAIAQEKAMRVEHLETSASAAPTLASSADTLTALGLSASQSSRTSSYAATLGPKDGRAASLQDQFTANAQATNPQRVSIASALSNTDTLSALGLEALPPGLTKQFALTARGTDAVASAPPQPLPQDDERVAGPLLAQRKIV